MSRSVPGERTRLLGVTSHGERPARVSTGSARSYLYGEGTEEADTRKCCWRVHSSIFVLLAIFLERLGMFSVRANLVTVLQQHDFLNWSVTEATIATLLCSTVPRFGAVVTGSIADTKAGRYTVYVLSLLLEFLGSGLLWCGLLVHYKLHPEGASPASNAHIVLFRGLVVTGLLLFGLGVAGSSGTEIPLGVDQHALRRESESQAKVFFPRYYWLINLAYLISTTFISIIQVNNEYGYTVGFALPPLCYLLSMLLTILVRRWLLIEEPTGENHLLHIFRICREAFRVWRKTGMEEASGKALLDMSGVKWDEGTTASWVRFADVNYGGAYTYNEVVRAHKFLNVLAIISSTLFYQIMISQLSTSFTSQGDVMRLPILRTPEHTKSGHYIPSSSFSAFNALAILILLPLLHGVCYPAWQKLSKGLPLSHFKRIGAGMVIAIVSIGAAIAVESVRRQEGNWNSTAVPVGINGGNATMAVSSVSVLFQVPQYFLSGLAEILVIVSVLEFTYSWSPRHMKGVCMGLVYGCNGAAGLISVGIVAGINRYAEHYFYQENEQGDVRVFFAILCGLIVLGLLLFCIAAKRARRTHNYSTDTTTATT